MHINLTDGQSKITQYFDEEAQVRIMENRRPVSKAFEIAKQELEVESGIWPMADQPGLRDFLTQREAAA
tara:strand:+ start:38770 stop:38976 length:207 start_codon:yes stop_codon:yes gene_type:complete